MGVIHCPIRGGQRPHTVSSRIILTSGLQAGCAYERPNATVAALTCCSLFLFSSHIFCTVCNPPRQQAALYRASACHCSSPPQWPDCPSIVWQDNVDQRRCQKQVEFWERAECVAMWGNIQVVTLGAIICSSLGQRIENWCWQWSSAQQCAWDIVPLPLTGADVKVTCTESY